MTRFSAEQKYRFCQVSFIVLGIAAVYCLRQLSPFAEPGHNTHWFIALLIIVGISLPIGVGWYYYRVKRNDSQADTIAMETLAKLKRTDLK